MLHVFISYSKKDTRELALALNDALNAQDGLTAWVDKSLRVGRNWELQIQVEIDRCDYVVVLISPDINRHKQGEDESYVLTEISYAKRTARKPILPILAQPTDLPIILTNIEYIDYTRHQLTLTELVQRLGEQMGVVTQQAKPKPPPPKVPPVEPPQPSRPVTMAELEIEDVFNIARRGTVVTGKIGKGSFSVGDAVKILDPQNPAHMIETEIQGIESFAKTLQTATEGQNCGLLLKDVDHQLLQRGYRLFK